MEKKDASNLKKGDLIFIEKMAVIILEKSIYQFDKENMCFNCIFPDGSIDMLNLGWMKHINIL